MIIKRRTKLISRAERKFSVSVKRQPLRFFCPACGADREMLSINEAAKEMKTAWREIVRRVENGALHAIETEAGEIYICGRSLFAQKHTE